MNLNQIHEKLTSGSVPDYFLGGLGIILVLLTLKLVKGWVKTILVVVGLVLLGVVWWYSHHR